MLPSQRYLRTQPRDNLQKPMKVTPSSKLDPLLSRLEELVHTLGKSHGRAPQALVEENERLKARLDAVCKHAEHLLAELDRMQEQQTKKTDEP